MSSLSSFFSSFPLLMEVWDGFSILLGIPPKALPNWDALVREVATTEGIWKKDGVVGAPLEWSLLTRECGRLVPVQDVCVQSGRVVSGATSIVTSPDGTVSVDGTHWGVRCSRCGCALHWKQAGMTSASDIPSCNRCRKRVEEVIRG